MTDTYTQFDEDGNQRPVRLPLTENSEQWEIDLVTDVEAISTDHS